MIVHVIRRYFDDRQDVQSWVTVEEEYFDVDEIEITPMATPNGFRVEGKLRGSRFPEYIADSLEIERPIMRDGVLEVFTRVPKP